VRPGTQLNRTFDGPQRGCAPIKAERCLEEIRPCDTSVALYMTDRICPPGSPMDALVCVPSSRSSSGKRRIVGRGLRL
jgi:hypothetical protein